VNLQDARCNNKDNVEYSLFESSNRQIMHTLSDTDTSNNLPEFL